eukprot:4853706-Prymnesium_polylepis.1
MRPALAALLLVAVLQPASGVRVVPRLVRSSPRSTAQFSIRAQAQSDEQPRRAAAYIAGGAAVTAAWSACSVFALATYKVSRAPYKRTHPVQCNDSAH